MAQLYAVCRQGATLLVKNVRVSNPVETQLTSIFRGQETSFNSGINNEIDFTGDWTPDPDELLIIRANQEAKLLNAAAAQNAVSLPDIDANNFEAEGIKALFTTTGTGQNKKILIQAFSTQQFLSRKFALLFKSGIFQEITEPAFSLENNIVAIIDIAGDIRFKSFNMLRRIFDLPQFFRQATDAELATFCAHASLDVTDKTAFVSGADEMIRKSVHSISKSNVLASHSVTDISNQAAAIGFPVAVNGGKITVPPDRKGAKALLSFLLDKVYLGSITRQLLITNSHRPLV
jgi:hypothetical protein